MRKVLLVTVILLTLFSSIFSQSFSDIVSNGTPEEVQKAIQVGANITERDSTGQTPLMRAASNNQKERSIN